MVSKILILGAGFGGLEAAITLRAALGSDAEITLIDKKDYFILGFTKFDLMFNRRQPEHIKSYYRDIHSGINFKQETIEKIDVDHRKVTTNAASYTYDHMIIGLGADVYPELTPGLVEGGQEFYTLEGATRSFKAIDSFDSGTILVSILGKPYKCPPAPYEAAYQLNDFFISKGIREQVDIKVLSPAKIPIPLSQKVSDELMRLMKLRNVEYIPKHKVTSIDPDNRKAMFEEGGFIAYDLFFGIPIHKPPKVIIESGLGNEEGWIEVDPVNLRTPYENVYAIGDVTHIPVEGGEIPKAGALAESAAQVVVKDILNKIKNQDKKVKYDGLATCMFECGRGEVAILDVNFLGGDKPVFDLKGPSLDYRIDKDDFELSRNRKWFTR